MDGWLELLAMSLASLFAYDPQFDLDVRSAGVRRSDQIISRNFTYATPFGYRRAAYLVRPRAEKGAYAGILYLHWFDEAPNANREQFLEEAMALGKRGCVSLLIETMWSDRDWFIKRTQADDYANSIRQVIELRLALRLLLAEKGIDPTRLALVGHDFGAMYGLLLGGVEPRPRGYVLMAGTPRFSDWYLYYPPLDGAPRHAFEAQMAPLDPIHNVAALAPAPILFQFGQQDPHVPIEQAQAFYDAAGTPKQIQWYDAGHALNEDATNDRLAWLAAQLHLPAIDQ